MFCPKCNEGFLIQIQFKRTERTAFLCDECNTVWFEGENINEHTGMPLEMYTQENGYEYTIEQIDKEDLNLEPVQYKSYR